MKTLDKDDLLRIKHKYLSISKELWNDDHLANIRHDVLCRVVTPPNRNLSRYLIIDLRIGDATAKSIWRKNELNKIENSK